MQVGCLSALPLAALPDYIKLERLKREMASSERDGDLYVNVTKNASRDGFDAVEERLSTASARHLMEQDDADYASVLYPRPSMDVMSPTSSSSNGSAAEFYPTGASHQMKHNAEVLRASTAAAPTSTTATETDSDLEESRSDADKEKEHVVRATSAAEDKRGADDAEVTDDEECKGLGGVEEKDQDRFKLAIALDFETDTNGAMSIGPPSVTRQTSSSFSDLGTMMTFRSQMRSQ